MLNIDKLLIKIKMVRVKRGNVARKRRKKILSIASGYRGAHSSLFRSGSALLLLSWNPPHLAAYQSGLLSSLAVVVALDVNVLVHGPG